MQEGTYMATRKKTGIFLIFLIALVASSATYFVLLARERQENSPLVLSFHDAGSATLEEVSQILIRMWLERFKSTLDLKNRLDNYEIEKIGSVMKREDGFVVGATFSVKPTFMSFDNWIVGNGIDTHDGWIRHQFLFFKVTPKEGRYVWQVLGTGP
jgi:hypothetical protein